MKTPSMMDQNLLSATGANSNKNDESNQRLSNSVVNKSEESKAQINQQRRGSSQSPMVSKVGDQSILSSPAVRVSNAD